MNYLADICKSSAIPTNMLLPKCSIAATLLEKGLTIFILPRLSTNQS